MDVQPDPLDALFDVDVTRHRLADVLLKYARVDPKTLHILYFDAELPNRSKILLYLLARRAMRLTGRIEREGARAMEIAEATGINGNSVRPLLHHFEQAHLINHTDNLFRVPLGQLSKVIALIESGR